MAFNVQNEINKLLNSLEPEETDINKIAKVAHKSLLMMSIRDVAIEMKKRKKEKDDEKEELNDEDEIKLFDEMIKKSYLEKLDFMKKNTVKLSLSYFLFLDKENKNGFIK